ncbi:hypothetical protein B0H17DRAFT_1138329 [Mycena rosella]|uniref:Uncharacterized protein n=1 Tax=Mycena rosella TaxID=1033263 RepID=A0AAD7DA44_MYCRO|nr:hypothetical protein B0H17DRAFT_1138329 [Mycena rosella]
MVLRMHLSLILYRSRVSRRIAGHQGVQAPPVGQLSKILNFWFGARNLQRSALMQVISPVVTGAIAILCLQHLWCKIQETTQEHGNWTTRLVNCGPWVTYAQLYSEKHRLRCGLSVTYAQLYSEKHRLRNRPRQWQNDIFSEWEQKWAKLLDQDSLKPLGQDLGNQNDHQSSITRSGGPLTQSGEPKASTTSLECTPPLEMWDSMREKTKYL